MRLQINLLLLFGVISQLHLSMTNPVPLQGELISGQDFLSLFTMENPDPTTAPETESSAPVQGLSTLTDESLAIPGDEAVDDKSTTTVGDSNAIAGDIGNDLTGPDGVEEIPNATTTISSSDSASTTTPSAEATQPALSSRGSRSSNLFNQKRVIVRKVVNIQRNSRTRIVTSSSSSSTSTTTPRTTTTTSSTTAAPSSGDSNYLEEAADRVPVNSEHRSELLFIEETDAKDLLNSESMNVPRIAKLPAAKVAGSSASSLVKTSASSSSSSTSSSSATTSRRQQSQSDGNDAVRGGGSALDNENLQRNSPFTLHRPEAESSNSTGSSSSNNYDGQRSSALDDDEVYDLESNASNNDQLVQERRMSTSRSRTQRKQVDADPSLAPPPAPPAPLSAYQTVAYGGSHNPIRLPVPRSITYGSLVQRLKPQQQAQVAVPVAPPSAPLYQAKVYSEPAKVYSEPAKVYSEPAKVYSEPAKVYGQPEKVYSEPAKFYSEPAKVYSEPAKFYSEPAKVYSEPAKNYGVPPTPFPVPTTPATTTTTTTTTQSSIYPLNRKVLFNLDKLPYDLLNAPNRNLSLHPKNNHFEPQPPNQEEEEGEPEAEENPEEEPEKADHNKVGYVVEGRTYRKYRVEEKTPDGFIVGEYGVVSHNDGNLRGVRYTADSNINPRLIYDALLKFLSL